MIDKYLEQLKDFSEAVYTQDGLMTFGFELEGFYQGTTTAKNKILKVFKDAKFNVISKDGVPASGPDGSLYSGAGQTRGDISEDNYSPIEFKSAVYAATPENFVKLGSVLKKLTAGTGNSVLFYTNQSCGFHVHFGFAIEKDYLENALWILFQFMLNLKLYSKFWRFDRDGKDIPFTHSSYASVGRVKTKHNNIATFLRENPNITKEKLQRYLPTIIKIQDYLSHNFKFDWLSVHNRFGTVEWRGPRNFLNNPADIDVNISNFIRALMKVMQQTSSLSENTHVTLNNYILTKKEFIKMLNDPVDDNRIVDFDKNLTDTNIRSKNLDKLKFLKR